MARGVKGFQKNHLPFKGIEKTQFKVGDNLNEKNPHWKGDKVSYNGLHMWIRRKLGKPDACEHCKKSGFSSYQIDWANKSGNYLRDLGDWIRLCKNCHQVWDKRNVKAQ